MCIRDRPGVLETIHKCNLRNYSIFIQGDSVFSYFEYIGDDYDKDMALMEEDSITQEWCCLLYTSRCV